MCRARKGAKGLASSVMLLDCAKLTHWRTDEQFDEMFAFKRDYMEWICLKLEPRDDDRPARAGVERLRPPEREDQAAAQHQALEPALEDRPAGRLHAGRQTRGRSRRSAGSAGRAQSLFGRYGMLGALPAASGSEPGALLLRPAARMPGEGRDLGGDAARRDGAQPRPPRRVRGDGAHAAPGRLMRCDASGR